MQQMIGKILNTYGVSVTWKKEEPVTYRGFFQPVRSKSWQYLEGNYSPLGAQLHRTGAVADDVIIGLDKRYALEQVKAGDVLVEYDKLIDQQLERAAITAISGFAKICDGASAVLNV